MLCWGTAFETIHSLGDLESDRALGLRSLPLRLGQRRAARLVPILHATTLVLLALFGVALGLDWPYFVALALMAVVAGVTDVQLQHRPTEARVPFERHFALGIIYFAGALLALFVPVPSVAVL
jgi:4-hydroxybenzoate polyprenyltransferase